MEYDYSTNYKGTQRSPLIVRILIFLLYMTAGGALIGLAGIILYGGGLFVVEADRDHTEHTTAYAQHWQGADNAALALELDGNGSFTAGKTDPAEGTFSSFSGTWKETADGVSLSITEYTADGMYGYEGADENGSYTVTGGEVEVKYVHSPADDELKYQSVTGAFSGDAPGLQELLTDMTAGFTGAALPSPVEKTEEPENIDVQAANPPAEIQAERTYPGSGESLTLNARDGQGGEVWSYTVECGSRISANGSVYDTLEWMENGDIVFINNASAEQLIAIDRTDGSELWKLNGCFGCPVVYDFGADGTLYIGSANEFYGPAVVAVSADGKELWRVTEYYTTTDITVREDHVSVDFDDWGYSYTVNFDFDGNRI